VGGNVPRVDTERALETYRGMNRATEQGLLRSSHTPTLGGIAVGLAFCTLAGDLGADVDLAALPAAGSLSDDARLFSESNSRFLVSCPPDRESDVRGSLEGVPVGRIGTVTAERRLLIRGGRGRTLVNLPLDPMRKAFKETLDGQ
jgi:phosphoribosylformylglycinamidine synthase